MKLLSPSIKARVIKHEFYTVVKRQPMFGFDERITAAVLEKLSLNLYRPDHKVAVQGESPDEMFFLVRGNCDVFKILTTATPLYVTTIKPGAMFGEVAAVLNCRSSASVICKNYCTIAGLQIEDYFMIAMRFPRLSENMAKRVQANYKDPMTAFFMHRYKRVDYLEKLDERIIEELSFHLKVVIYQYNQEVLIPG